MNIHNNTPFKHQVMNLKKKKQRSWWRWQILTELHLEKIDRSSKKIKKERNKHVTILRLAVTKLKASSEIVWWWEWQRSKLEVESVSESEWEREKRVSPWLREGEESEVVREMNEEWDGWVWNMRGSRVFLVHIYIYIYKGFLGNYILKRVKSMTGMTKTWTHFEFFFKTHMRPYYLLGRVKSDPLGSSQTGYPYVGLLLLSLE